MSKPLSRVVESAHWLLTDREMTLVLSSIIREEDVTRAKYYIQAAEYHKELLMDYYKQFELKQKMLENRIQKAIIPEIPILCIGDEHIIYMYFEFNSIVYSLRSFLDALLPLIQPIFKTNLPSSMNEFMKKTEKYLPKKESEIAILIKRLQRDWELYGNNIKLYRDLITHYCHITGSEKSLAQHCIRMEGKTYIMLPDNPEANSYKKMRFKKKIQVVDFAKESLLLAKSEYQFIIDYLYNKYHI